MGVGELLTDADGLAEGDVVVGYGVGLTDLLGCGLPAGVGEAEGCSMTRLGRGVGLGCRLTR